MRTYNINELLDHMLPDEPGSKVPKVLFLQAFHLRDHADSPEPLRLPKVQRIRLRLQWAFVRRDATGTYLASQDRHGSLNRLYTYGSSSNSSHSRSLGGIDTGRSDVGQHMDCQTRGEETNGKPLHPAKTRHALASRR